MEYDGMKWSGMKLRFLPLLYFLYMTEWKILLHTLQIGGMEIEGLDGME